MLRGDKLSNTARSRIYADMEDEGCKLNAGAGPKITDEIKEDYVPVDRKIFLDTKSSCVEAKTKSIPQTTTQNYRSTKPKIEWKNPLRSEMHYYLSTLRLAVPNMTSDHDKMKIRKWIFYLLRHVDDKTLRNRYLLLVTLSALSNECLDAVQEDPPSSVERGLPQLSKPCKINPARWETDLYWDRLVADLTPATDKCPLHNRCVQNAGLEEGVVEAVGGHLMDQEFKYMLYSIRCIVSKIRNSEERVRVSMWIQKLSLIRTSCCAFMKGLRNDYMQALMGYVSVGKYPAPFRRLPPEATLLPLVMEAKKSFKQPRLTELKHRIGEEFLKSQRQIENGAICFVAISGNAKEENIAFSPLSINFTGND